MKFKYLLLFCSVLGFAQQKYEVKGVVTSEGETLPFANIYINETLQGTTSDENGRYTIAHVVPGTYEIFASFTGFNTVKKEIKIRDKSITINFNLEEGESLSEITVTGTLKPVNRLETPVPVEIYSATFLRQNPTPNIFEALQNVNGVRPQINCNVCNTGDIHINGLEGPYTLVLIDGMPIVSGLSTVYGLSGIPNSLIEQVEIVKGPASSLYGSEAVGGLINVITKRPDHAPHFFAESYVTGWGEVNVDIGLKAKVGKKAHMLMGTNYFNYSNPIDNNNDNFTDLTLQDRVSIFQKWDFDRKANRKFSVAGRYFYEDRWGGEMQWNKSYRGGDEVYGESVYTSRYELFGDYQLPIAEQVNFQFSFSDHDQNSAYGDEWYLARQKIAFGQFIWDKQLKNHDLLFGTALRYNYYDDNTPATPVADEVTIPSLFAQDEIDLGGRHKLLLGMRYDYDARHGNIFTPRLAYRYKPTEDDIIRLNAGTGFRVVNLFTEEHAAITGAREVIITEELDPEQSYNATLNYLKKLYTKSGMMFTFDASVWYTYFTNAIIPDYDTNPNQIIYSNLDGHSITQGVSFNVDATLASGIRASLGATLQDVAQTSEGVKTKQMLTEQFSGVWSFSYKHYPTHITADYTGNIYGPMRLPLLSDLDPRSEYSPWFSIQNIQFTYDGIHDFEIYTGVKNLLNWTPNKGNPFIISRADDPFDKNVIFDPDGNAVATPDNPYGLVFSPDYVYGPNQGIRWFLGLRYRIH